MLRYDTFADHDQRPSGANVTVFYQANPIAGRMAYRGGFAPSPSPSCDIFSTSLFLYHLMRLPPHKGRL